MRVLVVDDDVSIVVALQLLLEKDGHTVLAFTNPMNAVREESDFDAIFTDFNMPSIDGVALLARLRDTHPNARRFLMTAYDSHESVLWAAKSGLAERIFSKPWRISDIRAALASR